MRKSVYIKVVNRNNNNVEYEENFTTGRYQSYKTIKKALRDIGEDVAQYEFHQSFCKNLLDADKTFKYTRNSVKYDDGFKILNLQNKFYNIIIKIGVENNEQ